jgi:lipoprotein-releasing system ATP-binding protein
MSERALEAQAVCKIYKGPRRNDVRAVDGVDLHIEKGSSVAIVGPSGAGKSTLLHMLGGLDRPTSGRVHVDGTDIYRLSDVRRASFRNSRIGFVFQFYHLLPDFTVLENVMMPALIGCTDNSRDRKARAMDLLKTVGLENRSHHRPSELSGGEMQRAAIARALVNSPQILLCDEPTGNLDSKNRDAVYELLFKMKSGSGMTLVIVTHDGEISKRSDRAIHIKDGMVKI